MSQVGGLLSPSKEKPRPLWRGFSLWLSNPNDTHSACSPCLGLFMGNVMEYGCGFIETNRPLLGCCRWEKLFSMSVKLSVHLKAPRQCQSLAGGFCIVWVLGRVISPYG